MRMLGKSHTDPEARPFALKVMQHLNDKCKEWKAAENISYSAYLELPRNLQHHLVTASGNQTQISAC